MNASAMRISRLSMSMRKFRPGIASMRRPKIQLSG